MAAVTKAGGVAIASLTTVGRPPVAPSGDKRTRKSAAGTSSLIEEAAKKKKKDTPAPHPRVVARAVSPATPTTTAPVGPAAAASKNGHRCQVLDEMPTSFRPMFFWGDCWWPIMMEFIDFVVIMRR